MLPTHKAVLYPMTPDPLPHNFLDQDLLKNCRAACCQAQLLKMKRRAGGFEVAWTSALQEIAPLGRASFDQQKLLGQDSQGQEFPGHLLLLQSRGGGSHHPAEER